MIPSSVQASVSGNQGCPGTTQTFHDVGASATVTSGAALMTSEVVLACAEVTTTEMTSSTDDIESGLAFCGGGLSADTVTVLKTVVADSVAEAADAAIQEAIDAQACLLP